MSLRLAWAVWQVPIYLGYRVKVCLQNKERKGMEREWLGGREGEEERIKGGMEGGKEFKYW